MTKSLMLALGRTIANRDASIACSSMFVNHPALPYTSRQLQTAILSTPTQPPPRHTGLRQPPLSSHSWHRKQARHQSATPLPLGPPFPLSSPTDTLTTPYPRTRATSHTHNRSTTTPPPAPIGSNTRDIPRLRPVGIQHMVPNRIGDTERLFAMCMFDARVRRTGCRQVRARRGWGAVELYSPDGTRLSAEAEQSSCS
jgi:hypothetical protein